LPIKAYAQINGKPVAYTVVGGLEWGKGKKIKPGKAGLND